MQKEIRNCKKLGFLYPIKTKFGRNEACIASHSRAKFGGVLLTGMRMNRTQNFEMSAVATFEGNSVFDPTVLKVVSLANFPVKEKIYKNATRNLL